jgi:uncharacterized membrane protein YjgN (DUF898 family)
MEQHSASAETRFEFRGTAREWFGIWIVNLVLSIITLGIYSAWAKVRTKKYFYQNTYVAGRNFDYHATGKQILIGRLIMIAAFVAYGVLSAIPLVGLVVTLALVPLFPFLLVRSMRFNAQMSSWSNVRFRFLGKYGGAFIAFILWPILSFITLFLASPFADRAAKRYTMSNHTLGKHAFSFDAPIAPFYKAFLASIAWVVVVSLVVWFTLIGDISAFAPDTITGEPNLGILAAIYIWLFLAIIPAGTIYNAMVRNVALNNLALEGGHTFTSDVIPGSLVWIAISNAVVTICSLGLMLPWAQVRMHRYLTLHTGFVPGGSLDDFVGEVDKDASAIGDAYTDLEGIELGLPV